MSIRSFTGQCWIAGWFDPKQDYRLMDIQQYDTMEQALATAKEMNPKYPAFVGALVNYDDLDEEALLKE